MAGRQQQQQQQQDNSQMWFQVLQGALSEAYDRRMVDCAGAKVLTKSAKDIEKRDSWRAWMRLRSSSREATVEECKAKVQRKLGKLMGEEGDCHELAQLSGLCTKPGGEYFLGQQSLQCAQVMQAFSSCLAKDSAETDPEPSRVYRKAEAAAGPRVDPQSEGDDPLYDDE